MKLEWKIKMRNIIGYENLYTIYKDGRVFGKKREKFLKPCINNHGYYSVKLSKNGKAKGFSIHRLLAEHFIENPLNHPTVDHISGDILNNKIENLRWANRSEQEMNKGIRSDNTSGFRGVCLDKQIGKWRAYIMIDGKRKHLGLYDTAEEASKVYEAEATKLFGQFRRQIAPID